MKVFVGLLALVGAVVAAPNLGIVGGDDAVRGEYPFAVAIQECYINTLIEWDCVYHCAGILLSEHYGLTSATCAAPLQEKSLDLKVMVGIVALNEYDSLRDMIVFGGFIIHPDYKTGGISTNDIAVMRVGFNNARRFDIYAQPAKLPAPGTEPSGDAVLMGWGSTGDNRNSNNLKAAHVPILSQTECLTALENVDQQHRDAYNSTSNICTGPLTGVNVTCDLDTGAILYQNGRVVGLASWTISPCGQPGVPSVFTKISHYVDWIIDTV